MKNFFNELLCYKFLWKKILEKKIRKFSKFERWKDLRVLDAETILTLVSYHFGTKTNSYPLKGNLIESLRNQSENDKKWLFGESLRGEIRIILAEGSEFYWRKAAQKFFEFFPKKISLPKDFKQNTTEKFKLIKS